MQQLLLLRLPLHRLLLPLLLLLLLLLVQELGLGLVIPLVMALVLGTVTEPGLAPVRVPGWTFACDLHLRQRV